MMRAMSARPAILNAARQLLESNGGRISLDEVAKVAGVSRQAIYLHFANRAELVLGVADQARSDAGLGRLAAESAAARTPGELLLRFVRVMAGFHQQTAGAQLAIEGLCRIDA